METEKKYTVKHPKTVPEMNNIISNTHAIFQVISFTSAKFSRKTWCIRSICFKEWEKLFVLISFPWTKMTLVDLLNNFSSFRYGRKARKDTPFSRRHVLSCCNKRNETGNLNSKVEREKERERGDEISNCVQKIIGRDTYEFRNLM